MNELFLGVIALSVFVMAAIQVGAIVVATRLLKRMDRLSAQIEQEMRPVFANLQTMTAEASRAAALAAAQVDRADRLFADVAQRVETTLQILQTRVLGPARGGAAMLAGLRAALAVFRDRRESGRRRPVAVEEEDALFIG